MMYEWARDVATDEGCVRIVKQSIEALGGLDVIVSNAVCIHVLEWVLDGH